MIAVLIKRLGSLLFYVLGAWEEKTDILRRLSYNKLMNTALVVATCFAIVSYSVRGIPISWALAMIVIIVVLHPTMLTALALLEPQKAIDAVVSILGAVKGGRRSEDREGGRGHEPEPDGGEGPDPWTVEGGARA